MGKLIRFMRRVLTLPAQIYSGLFVRPRLQNEEVQARFSQLSKRYEEIFVLFSGIDALDRSSNGYSWDSWSGKIRHTFKNGVDMDFLANSLITFTMVFAGRGWNVRPTQLRISACKAAFGDEISKKLLLEDYVGLPIISDFNLMTSANRAHHSCHLAYFFKLSGKKIWDANSIVEWGGGYGNMARMIRRMRPNITYIIVDLPELLSLQYIYLASLEGEDKVNIVSSNKDSVDAGKINLVSSELLLAERFQIACDAFISTWALTECPEYIQKFVNDKAFFSAKDVLIASRIDENNHLGKLVSANIHSKSSVPDLIGNHEYWVITQHSN